MVLKYNVRGLDNVNAKLSPHFEIDTIEEKVDTPSGKESDLDYRLVYEVEIEGETYQHFLLVKLVAKITQLLGELFMVKVGLCYYSDEGDSK